MSGIVIIFMVIVFIALFSGAKGNPSKLSRPMRNTRPTNFITYYDSLPDESQTEFLNQLDDLERMQMLEMLQHRDENMDVPQDLIDNFNDWTQSEEDRNISPYDSNSFEDFNSSGYDNSNSNDYNIDNSSGYSDSYNNDSTNYSDSYSDSSSWSDSYSGDSSSFSDSSSSFTDSSSSFSDSGNSSGSDF